MQLSDSTNQKNIKKINQINIIYILIKLKSIFKNYIESIQNYSQSYYLMRIYI